MVMVLSLAILAGLLLLRFSNQPAQADTPTSAEETLKATHRRAEESAEGDTPPKLPPFSLGDSGSSIGIPRLTSLDTIIPNRPRMDVTTYTVQPGDNLFAIAERFGLKPETVLWGNYEVLRDNPQFLRPGQELSILPTDGVYYQWAEGDRLDAVADFFGVEAETILEYPGNRLPLYATASGQPTIEPGTWLIIPAGRRALKDWGPPAITRQNPASAAYYGSGYCGQVYEGAIGIGTFVWPTPSRLISGYDYNPSIHPGLDIAGAEGNAVWATDSGVVVYAGWSEYGYGYLIVLDHGNGWQSAYAHLSAVRVTCGQSVAQGTLIGNVGNTGNSSGAHLHFELRSELYGKVNPWNFVTP
jgi:murein DD-endopeptidase MepM/ murein hydrolase activator NlpD